MTQKARQSNRVLARHRGRTLRVEQLEDRQLLSVTVPSIGRVVVAEGTFGNGLLESNDPAVVTWAAEGFDRVVNPSISIDDVPCGAIHGPHGPYAGDYYLGASLGPLAAGTHKLTIQSTDGSGQTATYSDTFTVLPSPTNISNVVVVEAQKPRDGVFFSNEPLALTWAVTDNAVWVLGEKPTATASLLIDGQVADAKIFGPYASPYANVTHWCQTIGPQQAGTHQYTIQMNYSDGAMTTYSGSFNVLAAGPAISNVVVAEAVRQDGRIDSSEQITVTWSTSGNESIKAKSLKIDGHAVQTIYGPYAAQNAGMSNWAGLVGSLDPGIHAYTIEVTDARGASANRSGEFLVLSSGVVVSNAIVVERNASRDGSLEPTEELVVTWAVESKEKITAGWLSVDGVPIDSIHGPYATPGANKTHWSAAFGPLAAGTHTYSIQAMDIRGNTAGLNGTFDVASPPIELIVEHHDHGGTIGMRVVDFSSPNFQIIEGALAPLTFPDYEPSTDIPCYITHSDPTPCILTICSFGTSGLEPLLTEQEESTSLDPEFASIVSEAQYRFGTTFSNLSFEVADLSDDQWIETVANTLRIDRDAGGYGWFFDPTPRDDLEFVALDPSRFFRLTAKLDSPAAQRVDLLTAVMHELGHFMGYGDTDDGSSMDTSIPLGVRRGLNPAIHNESVC